MSGLRFTGPGKAWLLPVGSEVLAVDGDTVTYTDAPTTGVARATSIGTVTEVEDLTVEDPSA